MNGDFKTFWRDGKKNPPRAAKVPKLPTRARKQAEQEKVLNKLTKLDRDEDGHVAPSPTKKTELTEREKKTNKKKPPPVELTVETKDDEGTVKKEKRPKKLMFASDSTSCGTFSRPAVCVFLMGSFCCREKRSGLGNYLDFWAKLTKKVPKSSTIIPT